MNDRRTIELLTVFAILAVAVFGVACSPRPDSAASAAPAPAEADVEAGCAADEAHDETSDLDRPLEEIFSEKLRCEHAIPQYTCDECRYELGVVKVAADFMAEADGLTIVTVAQRPLVTVRELPGEVRLDEGRSVFLGPRVSGAVRAIRADVGQRVTAGEVLFEVESAEMSEATAEFLRTTSAVALARATAEREEDLFRKKICPEKDVLEARAGLDQARAAERAARERLGRLGLTAAEVDAAARGDGRPGVAPVRAPFGGVVLERALSQGALVEPGQQVLLLADTSRVWVMTQIYEHELAAILAQQSRGKVRAEVVVPAYRDRVFGGVLDAIGGALDEATRTTKARVVVENPEGLLRPGMFAAVRLLVESGATALTVPAEAVLEDEGRSFVFVRRDSEYFVRRPVQVGRRAGGFAEVVAGLAGGEAVAARGAFLLKSDVLREKMGAGCAD